MSFTDTPLQGRRLDHHTFIRNKQYPVNRPSSPQLQHIVPLSYTNGAPTLGTRPPTKPSSPTRDRTDEIDPDEPALARFARLKQREQSTNTRTNRSGVFTSPPKPEKWSVKDTSVNIATAFHQAASTAFDMPPSNPNNSWASGRTTTNVPRSTSVEYEKDTQSTAVRRLAAPPNRLAVPRSTTRKPLSKTVSVRHVPDSEGEEDQEPAHENSRGKSPLEQVVDLTKRALAPATFYLRQRSQEPEVPSRTTNGKDTSYDYAAEEAEYQAAQNQAPASRRGNLTHKRNRMSTDNKAYRPSASDLEEDDEDFDDDGKKGRRRKKKKEPHGGPLMTLPVTSYDKKKRRKSKGSKGNMMEMEEDERSESDENSTEQSQYLAHQHASVPRESPTITVPHGSVPPEYGLRERPEDISVDVEQGLASIPEAHDDDNVHGQNSDFLQPQPSFSIGAFLGKCVHWLYRCVASVVVGLLQFVAMLLFILGRVLGTMFDVVFIRPAQWIGGVRSGTIIQLGKYIIVVGAIYATWYTLQEVPVPWIPTRPWGGNPSYTAPDVPPADIVELSARLRTMEIALSGLAQEHDSARLRMEGETRGRMELGGKVGSIETRLQRENARVAEAEAQVRQLVNLGLPGLKQEMEVLLEQVRIQGSREVAGSDEEARAKLKLLEERVGGVEGGVKEALEVGRSAAKAGGVGTAWWKLASGNTGAGLTIKAADGQDMTSLVGHLVDAAVSKYGKDVLARPDFALHSSGARIIPSLTSPTYEMSPPTLRGQIVGLITGSGYAIGRPPITALHHELHSGHCWPFAGSEGQLGVALAAPTFISDVTIDHVAKEVAFDMRSAPRQMELWGMVEGPDNIARVREWQAEKARRRKDATTPLDDEEPAYPRTLPISPQYMRIASFLYDIHAPSNIQTFPVTQEIRDLGVDFGIVVLMVKSNWGRSEFSCLYRLRVHGQQLREPTLPKAEELA